MLKIIVYVINSFSRFKIENSGWFLFTVLIVYLLVAYNSSGYNQEDEHYQIIEFANYKLGLVPHDRLAWEFYSQIRPGFQPAICFVFLKIFDTIGITSGYDLAFSLRVVSGLFSIFIIRFFVESYKTVIDPKLIPAFIFLSYFLWFLPYINVRFSSETWSGLFFLFSLSETQVERFKNPLKKFALIGAILGISILLRYQSALLASGMILWFIVIGKIGFRKIGAMILSIFLVLTAGVLCDRWLYGEFTITMYNYFYVNVFQGVASHFGTSPWYDYILYIVKAPGPIGILILISLFVIIRYRPKNIILWAILPFLVIHSIIPHKELRFLFPIANIAPLLLIVACQELIKRRVFFGARYFVVMASLFMLINCIGIYAIAVTGAGTQRTVLTEWIDRNYKGKRLNILLTGGLNPYMDWGTLNNTYYSSKNVRLDYISSIWQDDFTKHKKNGYTNLLVMPRSEITGEQTIKMLKDLGLTKVYQNIPFLVSKVYEIYDPALNDLELTLYEFR